MTCYDLDMRILLFLLLILPLTFDDDYVGRLGITDASAAEQEEPDKRKDKWSEIRKRVEEETEAWVEQIEEEDRKRREAED